MLENSETPNLGFIVHKNYYELILHRHSSAALEEWLAKLELIYQEHTRSRKAICILSRSDLPGLSPLHHAIGKEYQLSTKYPILPKVRSAFVLDHYALAKSLSQSMQNLHLNIEFKYLTAYEIEGARRWLNEWFEQANN